MASKKLLASCQKHKPRIGFSRRAAAKIHPPSREAMRRSWEIAWVLGGEYRPRIPLVDLWRVEAAFRAGPDCQSWHSVCAMAVLFGQLVEARR